MKLGVQNLHSWPRPGHPGINKPSVHSFCFSDPNAGSLCDKLQLFTSRFLHRWIYGTGSSLSLLIHSSFTSVVRVPLGASTAIYTRPFHLCASGCSWHISPNDRCEGFIQCLGHVYAEAAFMDGSCPAC